MSIAAQPLTKEDSELSPWWLRTVLILMVLDFACLIATTSLAYRNAPPLPAQVLDSHDVIRLRQAAPSGSVSEQVVQNAEDQMMALEAEMREAEAELNAIEAKVGGTSRILHPDVEAAKYKFIAAYLEYSRQQIQAPVTGYVSMRKVQDGNRVQPGDPLMTRVPLEHPWVEANLRETEMERVRPGQRAEITVDLYGKSHIYHSTVEGLVPGTGSVFALLPLDNAAGNFIHIVERVPVRIALQKDEILKNPIRPGLSTMTSINVKESDQPLGASLAEVSTQEYGTDIYVDELADAQAKAQKIIMDNLVQKIDSLEPMCKSSELGATKIPAYPDNADLSLPVWVVAPWLR